MIERDMDDDIYCGWGEHLAVTDSLRELRERNDAWNKALLVRVTPTVTPTEPRKGAMLPTNSQERKDIPIARGVLFYFPDAIAEVARVSKIGNDQHNPGQPLHWAKGKSTDHEDCIIRHLLDHHSGAPFDADGGRHLGKLAWRALALLQTEIEAERERQK